MARTPGLDSLVARNRKAAEVIGTITTPDTTPAATPPAVSRSSTSAATTDRSTEPGSRGAGQRVDRPASQPAGQPVSQPAGYTRAVQERTEALSASADRKQLSTYVRKSVIRDARRRAEDEGTTISEVVDRLLEGWLAGRIAP